MTGRSTHGQQQQQELPPTEEELRMKLKEYINFIDNILHPQLQVAIANREEIETEMKEYEELRKNLQMVKLNKIKNGASTAMVDLGCDLLFCQAKVSEKDCVFVSIGMGFHAEFTIDEALVFVAKRIAFLRGDKLPPRVDKAREVARHLESAMELLESLNQEMQNTN
jgi:prefoldin alpha subunit